MNNINVETQKMIEQIIVQTNKKLQMLQQLVEMVYLYKESILVIIDQTIKQIAIYQKTIQESLNEQLIQLSKELNLNFALQKYENSLNLNYEKAYQSIFTQLKNLEESTQMDFLYSQLSQFQLAKNQISLENQIEKKLEPFQYQLLEQISRKQMEQCFSITFNQDSSLIFQGSGNIIKISEFKNGYISNETHQLKAHSSTITCLQYLNKSKELISGSQDSSIIIWSRNNNDSWYIKQSLIGHKSHINCLVIDENENLLISGSSDQTIKFWYKCNDSWKCYHSLLITIFYVYGLSFDEMQRKLIVCGYEEPLILVVEQNECEQWKVTQKINTNQYGFRLSFIQSNMFVFQPNSGEYLEIYLFDENSKKFQITQNVKVRGSYSCGMYFPIQFIRSKQILIVKNNNFLNIIRIVSIKEFITQQSIEFRTQDLFGGATEDGQYLVIWDNESYLTQVRKLQYDQ